MAKKVAKKTKAKQPRIRQFQVVDDSTNYHSADKIVFGIGTDGKIYTWNGNKLRWDIFGNKKPVNDFPQE